MFVAMFSLIGKVIVWMAVFQNVGVGYAAVGMLMAVGMGVLLLVVQTEKG